VPVHPRGLSKSRFCAGLQCLKQLWWRVHEPDAPELTPSPAQQVLFDRGHRVGSLARARFPGGVLVESGRGEAPARCAATARAVAEGAPAVFEAAFVADGVFVAVDVLAREGSSWTVVEVKSTLDVKPQHVPDVAVQLHVVRASGLVAPRAELMHLDRACTYPDLSNLFAREEVTALAEPFLPEVPGHLRRMQAALAGPLPVVPVGPHCRDPYECPFMARCWPALPADHVSTLYRGGKTVEALLARGVERLGDVPDGVKLSAVAARQIRAVKEGRTVVEPGLARALGRLAPPVAYLDFETVMPAVPAWDGCHPYEQVPVQLSCHVDDGRGGLVHHEHLADGPGDPRPAMAEAVLRACAGARTVVAYNAPFERRCLTHLAEHVPGRREALLEVAARLVDLLPLVRDHVYHPAFGGSFGMKAVAPALVPGLSYAGLDIGEGGTASAVLEALLLGEGDQAVPAGERETVRRQLLAYCEQDTRAMVEVVAALRRLV